MTHRVTVSGFAEADIAEGLASQLRPGAEKSGLRVAVEKEQSVGDEARRLVTVSTAIAEVLSDYLEADFATDGVPDVGPALAALAEEFELDLDSMAMSAAEYVAVGKLGSKEVFLKETPDYEESPAPVYLGTTRVGYVEYGESGDNVVRFHARVGDDFETGVRFAEFPATVEPDTTNDAANRAAMAVAQEAGK